MITLSMHIHTFSELSLTSDFPQKPLILLPQDHQDLLQPPGRYAKWGHDGPREVPGSFRLEEGKASVYSEGCLQNGLCLLRAFIYFYTSLRPLTPVWSQRTRRKILYFHEDWQHSLAGRELQGNRKPWPRTSQGPGMTARVRTGKRMTLLLPGGHTSFGVSAGRPHSLTYLSISCLLVSFMPGGRGGTYLFHYFIHV